MISLLYIDENTDTLKEARRYFEESGTFSVTATPSAAKALQILHDHPFDVIVSAPTITGTDEITLLQRLRDAGDRTPFVCLANEDDNESIIQALGNGANLCIYTPGTHQDHKTLSKKIRALVKGEKKIDFCEQKISPTPPPCSATAPLTMERGGWRLKTAPMPAINTEISRDLPAPHILGESERFYTSLIDSLLEGIVIIDLSGRVLYANQVAREMGGNTSFEEDEGTIYAFISPEYHNLVTECMTACRTEARTFSLECPITTCTGEKKEIEALGSTTTYLGIRAIVISVRDITKRIYAERALREAEKNNRELVQGLPEYVIVYSDARGVIFTNPAAEAALGGGPDDLAGTPVLSLVMQEFRERFQEVVADGLSRRKSIPREIMLRTLKGTHLPVTVRAAPITYLDEDAVLLVLTDITERLVLEKELEYHAAELKRFSESLARTNDKLTIMGSITRHDILNQLTVLLAHLEIAEEEEIGDPTSLHHLKLIHQAATNIQEQIEFTRDYQDIGVREPQWCRVERSIARLRPRTLTIHSEVRGLEVYADPLFERVFFNLLDNAERHSGGASTVRISCREEDCGPVILWEDDGTGVRDEKKELIFRRGYGNNTGLGLFLCREILSITGIEIRESGEYGKGARFEILVPKEGYRMMQDPARPCIL